MIEKLMFTSASTTTPYNAYKLHGSHSKWVWHHHCKNCYFWQWYIGWLCKLSNTPNSKIKINKKINCWSMLNCYNKLFHIPKLKVTLHKTIIVQTSLVVLCARSECHRIVSGTWQTLLFHLFHNLIKVCWLRAKMIVLYGLTVL